MKNIKTILFILACIVIGCRGGRADNQTTDAGTPTVTTTPATPEVKVPQLPAPPSNINVVTDANGHEMVRVPAGEFIRGNDKGEADEKPVKKIFLSEFLIDRYEVSNAEYQKCTSAGRCRSVQAIEGNGAPDQPVEGLSWDMANAYCRYVGERLPTEAEWEKAARGSDGRTYPWGEVAPVEGLATFAAKGMSPVKSNPNGSSPYGALNMAGNVMEWVNDWYGKGYYAAAPASDPKGPPNGGGFRVMRGGSYRSGAKNIRSSYRVYEHAEYKFPGYGVRCAK